MENMIYEKIRTAVDASIPSKFKSRAAIASLAGIPPSNFSLFMGRKRTGFSYETTHKLMAILGLSQDDNFELSAEAEQADSCSVAVVATAGAGQEWHWDDNENEDEKEHIRVPLHYKRVGLKVLRINGDSMEPTIQNGAYVGILPFSGRIEEGKIYAVNRQPYGLIVKRIFLNSQGEIVLRSDNPIHDDKTVPYEGYDNVVIARVVWVLQEL